MKKNPYKGKFIVFEGPDGSGQTTQANLLKDYLEKKGFEMVLTKEPTLDSGAGREVRRILNEEITVPPTYLQELFAEDRAEHLRHTIVPSLKSGKIVISDRYLLSSLAFGTADGATLNYLIRLNKEFLEPDLTFLLKVPPKTCIERIKKRGIKQTLFEKEKQLEKVWNVYKKLARRFANIVVIDGEKSIEEIHQKIRQIVKKTL